MQYKCRRILGGKLLGSTYCLMMQKQDPSLGFATGQHSVMGTLAFELRLGIGSSPSDIQSLELVESCEHTSAGDAAQDVCTSSLHQRHETFILHDLEEAVHGALVFHAASRSHHHSPPHGVNGVGHEARSDSDSPAK